METLQVNQSKINQRDFSKNNAPNDELTNMCLWWKDLDLVNK